MKRHPAFQDLSRDHLVAMNHVIDIRRVVESDRFAKPEREVRDAFVALVQGVLPEHFREEEELLLPELRSAERAAHASRLESEHDELRAAFSALEPGADLASLWAAAQGLQAHIRWEEDDLFESMQRWLTEAELGALVARNEAFRGEAGLPVGTGR